MLLKLIMEAGRTKALKIAIELHEGEESTKKVWRFNTDVIHQYSRDVVEAEIISLFPQVQAKGLRLNFFHFDEIAGRVQIESDGDMQEALTNFNEEWHGTRRHEFLVLHAEDTCPISAAVTCPAEKPSTQSSKSRKVRHYYSFNIYILVPQLASQLTMLAICMKLH